MDNQFKSRSIKELTGIKSVRELYDITPAEIRKLKLNPEALRKVTEKMAHAARKQIARLEAAPLGSESPALRALKDTGVSLYTKGRTDSQIADTFNAMMSFHGKKTSTATGWKRLQKKTQERIEGPKTKAPKGQPSVKPAKPDKPWTDAQQKKFWKAYRETEKKSGGFVPGESDDVQRAMRQMQMGNKKKQLAENNMMLGTGNYSREQLNELTKSNQYIKEDPATGQLSVEKLDMRSSESWSDFMVSWADSKYLSTAFRK